MKKFTLEQKIDAVCDWQDNPLIHPLTCGNNSRHSILVPKRISGDVELQCPDCDYKQLYVPDCVYGAYSLKILSEEYIEKPE